MAKIVYTPEIAATIVKELAKGVPKKFAAELAGVSYDALNDWEHGRGGIPDEDVDQFRQSIMRATASAVQRRIQRIEKAGRIGDWRADAWYLEHVHADVFAARQEQTHTGPGGEPLTVTVIRDHAPESG